MRRQSKRTFNVLAVFLFARSFSFLEDLAAVVVFAGDVVKANLG